MLIHLFKYIRGYVKVSLQGYSPERFINLCSNRHILLWDLKNTGTSYEMCMSVKGFLELKPILKKTKTRLVILERHGLPFFLNKYRKRKMFFTGSVLCCFIIYVLSLFIWQIEVVGNSARTTDVILDYLKQEQVYHGIQKKKVDCEAIESMLRIKYNDIIWASAEIKGTRLIIHVQENTDTSVENLTEEGSSDLISNKEAIIVRMITRSGTPKAAIGDIVKEGDVLISGRLDIYNDSNEIASYQYCNADSDIYGKTFYEYKDEFPFQYEKKDYSGRIQKEYFIKFFDRTFTIGSKKVEYKEYETFTDEIQAKLGKNFYLPFAVGRIKHIEYTTSKRQYTKEEAKKLAKENLNKFCAVLNEKGVQIVENDVRIETNQKKCITTGKIVVVEKIGIRKPTEIINIPEEGTQEDEYHGENN